MPNGLFIRFQKFGSALVGVATPNHPEHGCSWNLKTTAQPFLTTESQLRFLFRAGVKLVEGAQGRRDAGAKAKEAAPHRFSKDRDIAPVINPDLRVLDCCRTAWMRRAILFQLVVDRCDRMLLSFHAGRGFHLFDPRKVLIP